MLNRGVDYVDAIRLRTERDEYKQAADALARALDVLTAENDKLRSQISRMSSPTVPAGGSP